MRSDLLQSVAVFAVTLLAGAVGPQRLALAAQDEPGPTGPQRDQPPGFELLQPSGLRVRVDPLPGCRNVALWLAFGSGEAHDPADCPGLARAVGEVLRGAVPPPTAARPTTVAVLPRATMLGITVPVDESEAALEGLRDLCSGATTLDDAALEQARDRALLRADDEREVLPGPVLRGLAAAAMRPEDPAARRPDPEALGALSVDELREAVSRALAPERAWLAVLGGVDGSAGIAEVFADLEPSGTAAPQPTTGASPQVPELPADGLPSEHVDAPFVVAAISAPHWGEPGFLPFLIGMEAMRLRAAQVIGTIRGGELRAEFPPVHWDPLLGPSLAFVERRGTDDDDVARVEQELRSFLAGFRTGGPTVDEVRGAMRALLPRLELPPPSDPALLRVLAQQPGFLHERGRVAILYTLNGWPADLRASFEGVLIQHVRKVMAERLDPGKLRSFALRPDRD